MILAETQCPSNPLKQTCQTHLLACYLPINCKYLSRRVGLADFVSRLCFPPTAAPISQTIYAYKFRFLMGLRLSRLERALYDPPLSWFEFLVALPSNAQGRDLRLRRAPNYSRFSRIPSVQPVRCNLEKKRLRNQAQRQLALLGVLVGSYHG